MTREKIRLMLLDETRQPDDKNARVYEITAQLWHTYFLHRLNTIEAEDVLMLSILSNIAYLIDDVSDESSKIDVICHIATLHKRLRALEQNKE